MSLQDEFQLTWRESGGPPVVEPKHVGFGSLVTQEDDLPRSVGSVDMAYAPTGGLDADAPRDAILSRN